MAHIYETENFNVLSVDSPHIDRDDGGHIIITPKIRVVDRQELSPRLAIELMRLTIVVGEAMKIGMNSRGVDIGRINYQDNGNWGALRPKEKQCMHYHLYGRAKTAKYQKYGEACYFPLRDADPEFYKHFKPLQKEDILAIRKECEKLFHSENFSDIVWGFS